MDGIKIAAGVALAGVLTASFYNVGISNNDGRYLKTQDEFSQEARTLLQKEGFKPGRVMTYDYSDVSEVAQMTHTFKKGLRDGTAKIACSGNEALQDGTHCRIEELKFKQRKKILPF